jgi:small subunit ribosomal protein S17
MPRRILEGNVVSDKMDKTVTVLVERRYKHPVYKKYVKQTDKFAAHDETNNVKVGDRVRIEECSPISKRKSWRVITDGAAASATEPKKEAAKKKPAAKKTEEKKAAPAKNPAAKKPAAKKTTEKKAAEKKPAAKKTTAKKTTAKKSETKKDA